MVCIREAKQIKCVPSSFSTFPPLSTPLHHFRGIDHVLLSA
jgi:hypothetical protein